MRHHRQRSFPIAMLSVAIIGGMLLMLPVLALLWRGSEHMGTLDEHSSATMREAIRLSLLTSTIAMAIIALLGTPLAWWLARSTSIGARLLDACVDMPIVLPPAVAGIALLTAFGRQGLLGPWLADAGIRIGFTTAAVVIAQVFVAMPFFVRATRSGFQRVDASLEESAADLGASPGTVFRRVTLPLARSGLLAGLVLAWARALGEFGATLMFAGNREGVTQTMPLAIYERFGAGDLPAAIAMSCLLLVVSLGLLVVLRVIGERTS